MWTLAVTILKFTKYYATKEGYIYSNKNGKLTGTPNNCHMGYLKVSLYGNGKRKTFLVHNCIWEFFNGKIPDNMQVDHKDRNPLNNRLSNLRLVSQSENMRNRKGVISLENEANLLRDYHNTKPRPYGFVTKLGKKYGVSRHVVNKIVKRSNYNIESPSGLSNLPTSAGESRTQLGETAIRN